MVSKSVCRLSSHEFETSSSIITSNWMRRHSRLVATLKPAGLVMLLQQLQIRRPKVRVGHASSFSTVD
jgi:hypothetical protein